MYFEIASDGNVIGYNAVNTGIFEDVSMEPMEKSVLTECAMEQLQKENPDGTDFVIKGI